VLSRVTEYADLPEADQVAALRPLALEAAAAFGLEVDDVELAAHAYNTTFRAEAADGRSWALRVGTGSKSTPAHVVAQQSWLEAIAEQTEVVVPVPRRTTSGGWYAELDRTLLGRPLLVTAASWLPGDELTALDAAMARELGRTAALLHAQAEHWSPPEEGELPLLDHPLFGDEDRLDTATWLDEGERAVIDQARETTAEVFARLHDGARLRPIHADLHRGNLKWAPEGDGGRLAVFDLDDCGIGLLLVDLAIAVFYLREGDPEEGRRVEDALWEGYAGAATIPDHTSEDLEALLAARQLLLANDLLSSTTAEFRAMASGYAHTSARRLRRWLDTGRFTRDD
jgi:Ser/Thr protein kinase RdoA (MazF antagonist)